MEYRIRSVFVTFLAAAALSAGCRHGRSSDQTAPEPPHRGGTLRILNEAPNRLDPVGTDEIYESVVVRQIYDGLVTLDPSLRLQPGLARSWTISADGLHYLFHLRHGAVFHDGSPLTARDASFSLHRCLAPDRKDGCMAENYLMQVHGAREYRQGSKPSIEGIRVVDDFTLAIDLDHPSSMFLKVLAMDQTLVVSGAAAAAGGPDQIERAPVGTGPFRFVRRRSDGGVVLSRFPSYWAQPAQLDTLVFLPLVNRQERTEQQALADGEADLALLRSGMAASKEARSLGLSVYRCPELSLSFIGLRLDHPPFNVPQVRRAALLAIRRDALQAMDPEGILAVRGLLPPGFPGRDPVDRVPPPNPAEAQRLLAEAGYPGGRGLPEVAIGVGIGGPSPRIMDQIRGDWEAVGFRVRIAPYPWRELYALIVAGKMQAFYLSCVGDIPDPDSFLSPLFDSKGEMNFFGYASGEVDALLEQGRVLATGPERTGVYLKVQDLLLKDVPLIPLYHTSRAYAWRAPVHDVEVGPTGLSQVNFCRVYIDPPKLAQAGASPP